MLTSTTEASFLFEIRTWSTGLWRGQWSATEGLMWHQVCLTSVYLQLCRYRDTSRRQKVLGRVPLAVLCWRLSRCLQPWPSHWSYFSSSSLVLVNRVANVQPCSAVTAVSSPYLCCSYLPKVTHSLQTPSSRSSLRNLQSVPTRWPKYLRSATEQTQSEADWWFFSTPSDIVSPLENSRTCRLQGSHVAQQAASWWRRRRLFVRSSRVVPSVRQQWLLNCARRGHGRAVCLK